MFSTLKNFVKKYFQSFSYFYIRLRYRIFIRMGLSISVGLLDGFGLAMFLPLLQMADGSSKASSKGLGNLSFLVDGMQAIGLELILVNILLVMTLFFAIKGVAQYINSNYEVVLRQFFIKTTRIKLSVALSNMSYKSFVLADAGRIQNTMSGEVGKISLAYQNYFATFQQGVLVFVYMLFAFFVDPKFALLILVGGGLTNLIYRQLYSKTKGASRKLITGTNIYQSLILQFVSNFKYLKATGNIKKYNEKLISSIEYIEGHNTRIGKLGSVVTATREPLLILVVSCVILVQLNVLNGLLSTILISLLFFYRALSALMVMQASYNNFLAVSGSMDNMTQFEKDLEKAKEKDGKEIIKEFSKNISLTNVSFSYGDIQVLRDINLQIDKNQTVAFIGESGSGKTTLVNILCGLLPVGRGTMTIDEIDSKTLNKDSFQKKIGYITQEPVIFSDTIFNNISFWDKLTPESLARFQWAVQKSSISDFVDNASLKENTMLGNNGINLSGGQKQRISIARELYKECDILVLDEATSALDSQTEKVIQAGLDELQGMYTILIVAHRLSTVKNADRIYLMDKGSIVDSGNFDELIAKSDKFKKMVELQEF